MNKIYKTSNYKGFTILDGNRSVKPNHVAKLKASITANNMLAAKPIVVNDEGVILDGQHRFTAAKELGVPIYYVYAEGDLSVVQRLNEVSRNWTVSDYVESYVLLGNEEYIALKQFHKDFNVPYSTAVSLLTGSDGTTAAPAGGSHNGDVIRNGSFKVTRPEFAAEVMTWVNAFDDRNTYAVVRKSRDFIRAVVKMIQSHQTNLEQLKRKLQVSAVMINRCANAEAYLKQFEMILNWKNKGTHIQLTVE